MAMGFLLPPIIVPDVSNQVIVASALRSMFVGTAAVTTSIAIIFIFCKYTIVAYAPLFSGKSILRLDYNRYRYDNIFSPENKIPGQVKAGLLGLYFILDVFPVITSSYTFSF